MRQLLGYLVSAKFQALATEMHIFHPPPHPDFALPKRSWGNLDCLARMRPAGLPSYYCYLRDIWELQ